MSTFAHGLTPFGLVACDVFRAEIEALGAPPAIEFLEMGLHDQPDALRANVDAAIGRLEARGDLCAIALAYGLCGNGLAGVRAHRIPLILPRAHDCIAILLGGMTAFQRVIAQHPATYFYTPGWVRERRVPGPDREAHIRELYAARYPDDDEMVEELVEIDSNTFSHYNCAAYVDITDNHEAEAYTRLCADCQAWRFHKLEGDPSMLRDLLNGQWDDVRFLTVPPGCQVTPRSDDLVVRAMPTEVDRP